MKTLVKKIAELGGELAGPASSDEIAQLETKLKVSLPDGLRDLLRQHNGSSKETEEAIWRFWRCSEITTHHAYRGHGDFCLDNNSLRDFDPTARAVILPGSQLILFVDALIDAPTYGVFHSPGHKYDGMVFDTSWGGVSALTFEDWIAAFLDHGEDGLIFPNQLNPNTGRQTTASPSPAT